jgi:hypothetical protein
MYTTVSYDVNAGQEPIDEIHQAIIDLFADRDTCDLLSDTFICEVADSDDYLTVVKDLRKIGSDFPGQFQFVATLHRSGDPLRSNGKFPRPKAKEIIAADDDE